MLFGVGNLDTCECRGGAGWPAGIQSLPEAIGDVVADSSTRGSLDLSRELAAVSFVIVLLWPKVCVCVCMRAVVFWKEEMSVWHCEI